MIPGEQEKLDRQIQVWNEITDLQNELQDSLTEYNPFLNIDNFAELDLKWEDNLPGYKAIHSLADIKNEFLQVSPLEGFDILQPTDLKFLYQKEWNLIKEKFLNLDIES